MQRFIFLLAFTFCSLLSHAQPGKGLDLNLFKDRNQTVKNAVAPGLFLVQQNFIAVDSAGQEYGFNNQDDFGTIYSIGIKVKEGLLLPSTFNTPGLLDSNFEPYRAGYTTRNSSIKTRGIDSLNYKNVDLASFNDQVPRIDQTNDDEYFGIKDYKSVTNGKLLLVYADDITKLDKETLKTNIIQVDELVWDDKGNAQPKNIVIGNKTLIGGIFFYEEVTFGAVTFEPVAFFENINGAWILKAIDIKQSPGGGLNPIDKKEEEITQPMKVEIFGSTDVGQVRDHNEDNFVLCKDLSNQDWTYKRDEQFDLGALGAVLFVADGMGGTNAGEVASEIAQESVAEEFKKVTALPTDDQAILSFVKKVVVRAHQNIVQRTHEDPTTAGMGTTAVVCWVVNDKAYVAWSGDSRMYLYRDGSEFYPITDDHSIVWELVKNGQLTAEEARLHENSNIITQSLGDEARGPKPDAKMVPLQKGDRVLLCSDGLSGMVSDNMLGGILSGRLSTAETCKELIQAANAAGGTDNITVLLLDVIEGKEGAKVSNKPNVSIKTAVSKNGGNTPINTVASKEGPNKGLIIGVIVVLVIIAAVVFFVLKPGQGDVGQNSNDTLVNPIDTPALNNSVIETPASVIETTQVNVPAATTTNTQTNNTAPNAPTKPPVTGSNSNSVTNGGNEKPIDNTSPKTTAPKDTTKPSGINVNLPKDTTKNNTPGGLTPRKSGPNLPKGGLNQDGGK